MRIVIAGSVDAAYCKTVPEMAVRRGVGILSKIVERGIRRGDLTDNAATQSPQLIIAPAFYLAVNLMAFGDFEEIDVDAYFEGHVHMVMRGMRG